MNKKELREVLDKRIDQHLKFFETIERIRWQFTAAFGAGAVAAIAFALDKERNTERTFVLSLLVFAFSLAGLVTQIRIRGLMGPLWHCICDLQATQFEILKDEFPGEITGLCKISDLEKPLSFPRSSVFDAFPLSMINVAVASCFLFSLLGGIGFVLLASELRHATSFTTSMIVSGAIFTASATILALVGSFFYAKAVAEGKVGQKPKLTEKKSTGQPPEETSGQAARGATH